MPKVGEEEFAYTPEGIEAAKAKSLETGIPSLDEGISSLDAGIPMTNAPDRVERYQLGGMVEPPQPITPSYKKGGKVNGPRISQEDWEAGRRRSTTEAIKKSSAMHKRRKHITKKGELAAKAQKKHKKAAETTAKKILTTKTTKNVTDVVKSATERTKMEKVKKKMAKKLHPTQGTEYLEPGSKYTSTGQLRKKKK